MIETVDVWNSDRARSGEFPARAVVSMDVFDLAIAQGFVPRHDHARRPRRKVEGVGSVLDLVVIDPEAAVR